VSRGTCQTHRFHDGECLRIEDIDGRGLSAQDKTGGRGLVGVGLLQGGNARHDSLTFEWKRAVSVNECLKKYFVKEF